MKQTKGFTMRPRAEKCVYVSDFVETRYGVKATLGGDTYDVLSSNGMNVADELDFHEHHCAWDGDRETWTIDPDSDSLDALDEALRSAGLRLNGLSARLGERLHDVRPDDGTYWAEHDITIRVTYESKQSGNEMVKEGTVSSYDSQTGRVGFKRDDHKVNFVHGTSILSQNSRYPYMGDVVKVEIEP